MAKDMVITVKKLLIIFVSLAMLLLTGCNFLTFSVDGLLASPIIADEQTAIHQALIAVTGTDVVLKYPGSGDYRSAFVLVNIDDDEGDEALAFYTLTSSQDETVKIGVLDRDENDRWVSVFQLEGAGNSIDKVMINQVGNNTDIVIGYSTRGYEGSAVRMYRYYLGALATIYDGNYSALELYDLDGCGQKEIVIVGKSGAQANVTVIKSADGVSYLTYEANLSANVSAISSYAFGKLDETRSILYVDVVDDAGYTSTELAYLTDEGLICPSSSIAGLRDYTRRQYGYNSVDYDGDGYVEVPLNEPFIGYSNSSWSDTEYITTWLAFDKEQLAYVRKSNAYYNTSDGYVFTLPNRWLNVVTAVKDSETGVVTFLKYGSAADPSELEPIMSFASCDVYDNFDGLISDGYTEIYANDFKRYFVKIIADEAEQLVLTGDEIRDNFYGLNQ